MIKMLENINDSIQYANKRLASYLEHREWIDELVAAIPEEVLQNASVTSYSLDLSAIGNSGALSTVWRALRTRGWNTTKDKPEPGDIGWSGFWRHPDHEYQIFLTFSSTVCKRVQVGTRMEEMPVYEVRCDE